MHPSKYDTANSGSTLKGFEFQKFSQTKYRVRGLTLWQDTCDCTPAVLPHCSSQRDAYKAQSHNILHWLYTLYFPQKLHRLNVRLMLGQQCRRWTSIKPGITGYLVYCCAALYIVYPALKEHNLLIILLFVNSIQNKVMALVPHILFTSN